MDKKKQLLLSIGLVLILVLMIVGISYAAFKFVGLGQKENTITTGAITMEYEESTNTISMTGALPTTDATGKVRLTKGEYFDFTIKSSIKGNTNINWEIAAEDITPSSAKKMAGKNIKLYLTKLNGDKEEEVMAPKVYNATTSANTKTGRPSGVMSLAKGTMSTSETTNYRLRMYVDEDYNPQGDGGGLSFSVKINAYGKVKEAPTGSKIKAYMTQANSDNQNLPETDFHTDDYRLNITSIITKNDNIVPKTAVESWDISEAQDGSVMAYVEKNNKVVQDTVNNEIHSTVSRVKDISKTIYATPLDVSEDPTNPYKLTIGGKGGIIANESMIGYFYEFRNMTSIDLSALDTSEATNMSQMFFNCRSLTSLDLSKFDTSNVTDMSYMFAGCNSLTSLDVSNFNTSEVTDMSDMFAGCNSLTSLDVSKFNTSNVTSMGGMFSSCSRLTSLDLRIFDTSNVTSMGGMFSSCSSLTSLDLRNFDTSKVTDMNDMFYRCNSLTSLDLRNFDTSKVTDMANMFNGCSSLTSLDLRNFDTSNVTSMGGMFSSCSSLTSLDLRNFDTSKVTTMGYMFEYCSSLTSLDLRNFDTSNVTFMRGMFGGCSKLTQITVSNKWVIGSSTIVTNMFNACGTDHVTTV